MDATGRQTLAEIVERYRRRHVRVMLCGMRPELFAALRSVGTIELVGEETSPAERLRILRELSGGWGSGRQDGV